MKTSIEPSRRVLLFDAEAYVWDVVRHALREDYRISAVAFRSAALRILQKDDPPDLIIVDLGPDGRGLALAIHGLRHHIPVVMACNNHDVVRRLMRLGCIILHKPHSPSELRECVDDAMANPDNNLLRLRTALERLITDHREREPVLRLFGNGAVVFNALMSGRE